jgi:hypothetical protein
MALFFYTTVNFLNAIHCQLAYFFRQIARCTRTRDYLMNKQKPEFHNLKNRHLATIDVQKVLQLYRKQDL